MKLGAACFGKTEVVGHDWLKGACRGESPSAALFFQSFSGGRKAFALREAKATSIKYICSIVINNHIIFKT